MRRARAAQPYAYQRGAQLTPFTLEAIPGNVRLLPLGDRIIVEPFEHTLSAIILIVNERRPIAGVVRAIGPGTNPKKYDHPDKHRRTRFEYSRHFQPSVIEVGDVIELGAIDGQGYAFETFQWGGRLHLHAREADIAAVHERDCECIRCVAVCRDRVPQELEQRPTA